MMTTSTPEFVRAELLRMLSDSVLCATELREILIAELDALEHRDTTELHKSAMNKEVCIGRLKKLETERSALSATCGFGASPEDMKPFLVWCDQESVVTDLWVRFLDLAMTCNQLNATNGSIIRLRSAQISNALAILRGGESEPELYGPEGRDSGGTNARSLAQA